MSELTKLEKDLKKSDSHWGKYTTISEHAKKVLSWPAMKTDEAEGEPYYTDHGVDHSYQVLRTLGDLASLTSIYQPLELYLLALGAWLHDIGMFVHPKSESPETVRKLHHERSAEYVAREENDFYSLLSEIEIEILQELCRGHRGTYEINDISENCQLCYNGWVRPQFLAALLRIADACHISADRAPSLIRSVHGDSISEESLHHWRLHERVTDVKVEPQTSSLAICYKLSKSCQYEVTNDLSALYLIDALEEELRSVQHIFQGAHLNIYHVILRDARTLKEIDIDRQIRKHQIEKLREEEKWTKPQVGELLKSK